MKVTGKGGISAEIIADSVSSVNGKRLTTFVLEYPRFVHSEMLTHRLLSRNAASSRAIPVQKTIEQVEKNPAMPIHWGKNEKGMQAKEECDEPISWFNSYREGVVYQKDDVWKGLSKIACETAEDFSKAGYHKQIVNRILEPYQFIKVVCSATEFDNFFWLRCHEDAQPEIKELADCMYKAYSENEPVELNPGEWHVPYYEGNYGDGVWKPSGYARGKNLEDVDCKRYGYTLAEALKVSSSCCAQISFRALDNSLEKACKIYDMLVESKPVHASPFEHQGTPMRAPEVTGEYGMDLDAHDIEDGMTHMSMNGYFWSGNFSGFIQHRQLIPENTCWDYSSNHA